MLKVTGYSWVPIVALLCYLFLFLTFLSSKRTDRVLRAFMSLLVIMIMWAGGSFAMRIQLWGAVNVWHHVSLLGMTLLVAGYYMFILAFLEEKRYHSAYFWLVFHGLLFVFNLFTGLFIPEPIVTDINGNVQFIYEYTWHIYILLACIIPCLYRMIMLIYRHCKGNYIVYQQLKPIITGLLVMVVCHIAATFPFFAGIPVDIISGPINVIYIFYALYKKRLFKMTVLFSKLNYLLVSVLFCSVVLYKHLRTFEHFLISRFGIDTAVAMVLISLIFLIGCLGVYLGISMLLNHIFIRAEKQQQARIESFGQEINHMLNFGKILQNLTDTIQELTRLERMLVFTQQTDGDYRVEHTTNPLDEKSFYIKPDHPLIEYFKTNNRYISLQELRCTTVYRSMWESEKQTLARLKADYFIPIVSEGNIMGILVLPEKKDNAPYSQSDLTLIHNLCSLCASPLNDADAYERAVDDAQKDKLTGLINRKYFFELLDEEFEKYKESALSLCIINLDNFKQYNQLYAVAEGDLAIQRVSALLLSSLNETSTVARIGGKEFALILPGYDIHSAKLLAENISAEIVKINSRPNIQIPTMLTASIGICAAPCMASSAKELFQNTEIAVYAVKRSEKNAVQVYSSEINYQVAPQFVHTSGYHENENAIHALTAAIDAKDHYTFQHSHNVAYYAVELAKAAEMDNHLVEIVKEAALLHDIGKLSIRENILNKSEPLTAEEFAIMKEHVDNAINIIRYLPSMDYVIPTVVSHHEHYDGSGYPRQLKSENIPIMGRILCIADSFDAMTSDRCYKKGVDKEEAIAILKSESGKQFDPKLVMLFIDLLQKDMIEIRGHCTIAEEVSEEK